MHLPTVSVVIPTRNRRASLERTLAPLRNGEGVCEVVVVDDGSDDDTPCWLAAQTPLWPELKVVRGAGLGPDSARQSGAEQASGEILLFIDDDEVPSAGLAIGHARHHARDENLIVCGYYPFVLGSRPSGVLRLLNRWYEASVAEATMDPSRGLLVLWGGNFSLRRAHLERLPLSVPEFDGLKGHGDHEFGLRCYEAGLGCIVDLRLRADHYYNRSLAMFRVDAYRSGSGAVLVHWLHPALVGPVPKALLIETPRSISFLLRLTDPEPLHRSFAGTMSAFVRACGTLGFDRAEERGLGVLYRIERRRGAFQRLRQLGWTAEDAIKPVAEPRSSTTHPGSASQKTSSSREPSSTNCPNSSTS
jgi:glycosyltransferase involved in cell wall biosynthesis